jgi:uncharacterized membrane protein
MRRAGLAAALLLFAALAFAPAATAYSLEGARVVARVGPDGALLVSERLTIGGAYHGAYRDLPIGSGQEIDDVTVAEDGRPYSHGGSTELGSIGAPDTFATTRTADGALRIVWHFDNPSGGPRTFTIEYRFRGLAVAYDDVVDVNLRVWGDQWQASLPRLDATLLLPGRVSGPSYRAWAGPAWVHGFVTREPASTSLVAGPVSAEQFVDLRVVFPRRLLVATGGAQVRSGPGLARIEREVAASVQRAEGGRRRLHRWERRWELTLPLLLLLGLGPGLLLVGFVYWRFGREPDVGYDREYEQEPPSDLAPALVPPLVREGTDVGAAEFTATLFDLIRRGRYTARPVTTERSLFGGLGHQQVADLELRKGDSRGALSNFERAVVEVVDDVVGKHGERLSRFRERIEAKRATNAERFSTFKAGVAAAIARQGWYEDAGRAALAVGGVVFFVAGALLLFSGIQQLQPELRWSKIVEVTIGVCLLANAAIVVVGFLRTPLWRRRRPEHELEAERWHAFRRYLTDFPRLQDAAPATLTLWERYLVYGIAFGIAERVLQAAHLQMPQELHDQSSIYWISPNGSLGGGASALGISDLSAGFGSALAPPSTGGSSGFSGGGFGGGGGGGGGAW